MKKVKMFMFLLIIILLSGCTLNYDLKITDDLLFEEKIVISESESLIRGFAINSEAYAKELKDAFINDEDFDHYFINTKLSGNNVYGIADTTYLNFDDLIENNKYAKDFFSEMNFSKDQDIITMRFTANPNNDLVKGDLLEEPIITNANIRISAPFRVINTNADEFDEENNTFIWKYNEDVISKSIFISFDTSDKFKTPIPNEFYVFGIVIVIFVLIGGFLYYKYKNNNKF